RFVLSLPLAPASAPDSAMPTATAAAPALAPSSPPSESPSGGGASAQAPAGSLAGLRVLIVEDEEAGRRPMAGYLTRRGGGVAGRMRWPAGRPDTIMETVCWSCWSCS